MTLLAPGCQDDTIPEGEFPAEVEPIVVERCQLCHLDPPDFGAPMPLTRWGHFHVEARDGSQVYEEARERLHNGTLDAMPPGSPGGSLDLEDDELVLMRQWLDDGARAAE